MFTTAVAQVYVSYWIENRTGLMLQFRRRRQLTSHLPTSLRGGEEVAQSSHFTGRSDRSMIGEEEGAGTDIVEGEGGDLLLYSVPKGGRQLLSVRVVRDRLAATIDEVAEGEGEGGWSPAFSLLAGPSLSPAVRSLCAGGYELGVRIAPAVSAAGERTRVVSLVQRLWITNNLPVAIECEQWAPPPRQLSQPRVPLAVGERCPFHWPQRREEGRLLKLRPAPGQVGGGFLPEEGEGWSGGFAIDEEGHFMVECSQGVSPEEEGWWTSLYQILVGVQMVSARVEVDFKQAPPMPPPYLLRNRSGLMLTCVQKGVERAVHRVPPHSERPFSWAESSMEHILQVAPPSRRHSPLTRPSRGETSTLIPLLTSHHHHNPHRLAFSPPSPTLLCGAQSLP